LADLPVITEETCSSAGRVKARRFVLVDPLDGTKEFVQGSTEFTVNIALVESGIPLAGAVYAPALGELYIGGASAYKLRVNNRQDAPCFSHMQVLKVRSPSHQGLTVVSSRSHLDLATREWIDRHRVCDLKALGSSLKFCMLAAGEADVYPRLAPTMEWDTAAGHAVLRSAGGVVNGVDGNALRYGKPEYRNPAFVAWGSSPAR
jgi:3'(2'), 5'-bisphosphate nucleotidase